MPNENLFENEQLTLAVGENLTEVCHILEVTTELLNELTDTPEESRIALKAALENVLNFVNDELMKDLFARQPCFLQLQRRNIEHELERRQKSGSREAGRGPAPGKYVGFRSKLAAVLMRQTLLNIRHLLNHTCVIQELFSEDSEAEKALFRTRIGQMLVVEMDMFTDLFIANPELAVWSWKEEHNWDQEREFRDRNL